MPWRTSGRSARSTLACRDLDLGPVGEVARRVAHRPRVGLDRQDRARRADRVGEGARRTGRRRRTGRAPAPPRRGRELLQDGGDEASPRRRGAPARNPARTAGTRPTSSRVSTRCTHVARATPCRAGTGIDRRRRAPSAPGVDHVDRVGVPATRALEHAGGRRRASVAIEAASTGMTSCAVVPAQPGPARGVDGELDPGAPAQAGGRRRAPARPRTSTVEPGQPVQLLGDHGGLELALVVQVDVLPVAAAAAAGPGERARRGDPVRGRLEHLDGVAAQEPVALPAVGDPRPGPARPAARAGRRPPGRRAGRRSGRRARPCRSQPRRPVPTSDCSRGAVGACAAARAAARLARAAPIRPSGRRAGASAALGRAQLPRHAGDHDTGREQQPALEPQRALVVQQLLPPVPDDVLGDVDHDDVARVAAPERP